MRLHIGNIHTGLWLPLLDLTTCMRNNDCWHSSPVPLLQDYAEKKHCGKNWNTIKPFFFIISHHPLFPFWIITQGAHAIVNIRAIIIIIWRFSASGLYHLPALYRAP
jgi:hypothetical protein